MRTSPGEWRFPGLRPSDELRAVRCFEHDVARRVRTIRFLQYPIDRLVMEACELDIHQIRRRHPRGDGDGGFGYHQAEFSLENRMEPIAGENPLRQGAVLEQIRHVEADVIVCLLQTRRYVAGGEFLDPQLANSRLFAKLSNTVCSA